MRAQVGEFQCYDRRALASLAAAAQEAGHPEWGYSGPHDSGDYNSTPEARTRRQPLNVGMLRRCGLRRGGLAEECVSGARAGCTHPSECSN